MKRHVRHGLGAPAGRPRAPRCAAACAGLVAAIACPAPAAAADDALPLGRGAWSWFGDPRAVAARGAVYTGWIDRRGSVRIARHDLRTRSTEVRTVKRRLGSDDHNNPSLLVRPDGRVTAFFSPHSGRQLPPKGIPSRMYVRTTRRPGSIRSWGPLRTVRTNTPGGLGYTYPNPVHLAAERRTWLFWRGGDWNPTFSSSRDGRRWTRARTLLRGPGRQRPYVKYDGNGRTAISVAYNQGHPSSMRTGVRYVRWSRGRVRAASGRVIATRRGLPFGHAAGQLVYRPSSRGRSWVHDVVDGRRPAIVYATYPRRRTPVYRYARWDGRRWRNHDIVAAGPPIAGRYTAGISLDHEDPRVAYLSLKRGRRYEIERWTTADDGATWSHTALTRASTADNIRPVAPRGLRGTRDTVVWLRGRYPGYRTFMTTVTTLRDFPAPPRIGAPVGIRP